MPSSRRAVHAPRDINARRAHMNTHKLIPTMLAAAGGLLAAAPAAHAGTYDAWSCRTPQGAPARVGDADSGWRIERTSHPGLVAQDRCLDGSGYVEARLGSVSQPIGARVAWKFLAPSGTRITGYQLHWSGYSGTNNGNSTGVGDVYLTRSDISDPRYILRHYGDGPFNDSSSPLSNANRVEETGLSVSWLTAGVACSPGGAS